MWWWVRVAALLAALASAAPALAQTPPFGLPDAGAPGPYAVGATTRFFQRTSLATGQQRNLETVIWYPANPPAPGAPAPNPDLEASVDAPPLSAAAPYPVLTWSHGNTGRPINYRYFLAHLASYGFVVVAPYHRGATPPGPDCPLNCTDYDGTPADWAVDRPDDLGYVLDQALALSAGTDPLLGGLLDPERIGGAGHSFGGWTTMALMAAKHRYKAAVAMAPGGPGGLSATLTSMAAADTEPVMLFAASLDSQGPLALMQAAYAGFPPTGEHWLLTLQRAGHMSFMNRCVPGGLIGLSCGQGMPDAQAHAIIERWATPFLLQRVAGDQRYSPYLDLLRAGNDPALKVLVAGR